MIKAHMTYGTGNRITGFELTGHAGYGVEGEDIVCAAVSVLTISTVNSLEQLAKVELDIDERPLEGGYLRVELKTDNDEAQLLLASLRLGLADIAQQYRKYIRFKD
ncbi:ribosomal-processing cysteine protease Prp [Ligilactobacillus equi]